MVQDGIETAYAYDALGQLIRVDDGQENATWLYTYDNGGNIRSKQKFALGVTTGEPLESKHFSYSNAAWRDQLTAVDGVAITYDAIGTPLSDGTWSYTWQNGRQLQKMQKQGETVEFVYNENGLRVQKTATSTGVTKYTLHGKNVVHMTRASDELHFFYDAQNRPAVGVYNGVPYAYVKSLQGDIVAILDENGNTVVSYGYDAWGAPLWCTGELAETLGMVQPFRYRGYVFDEETGLYYLRSRYYSSALTRFINQDAIFKTKKTLFSANMYMYCYNSPTLRSDSNGFESVNESAPLTYDRDAVIAYASVYWNNRDERYYAERNNNCARFVSQAIYEGLGEPYYKDWHYFNKHGKEDVTRSWRKVNDQFDFLLHLDGFSRGLVSIDNIDNLNYYISTFEIQKADLLYFSYNSKQEDYDHTAIISKVDENMLYYAANTTDRFDEPITTFFEIYPEGKIMVMLVSGGLPSEYED